MKKFILATLLALALPAFAQEDAYEELIQRIAQTEASSLQSELPAQLVAETPSFPNVSPQQAHLLVLAQQIAEKDGHKEPKLLQGLLMQESRAGADHAYKKAVNRCYGVLQLKIAAAVDVLTQFPELAEQHGININDRASIKRMLMNDDEFNLSVGSKYLLILQQYGYSTMKQLALAWNQGAGGAKRLNANSFPYVKGVLKNLRLLYP